MIEIKDLQVSYGKNLIFNKTNATFHKGNCYGIIGLNGSGKTTLFEAIYGFKRSKGFITLNGEPIRKEKIAYLPTDNYFFENLTAKEYLKVFDKNNDSYLITQLETLFNIKLEEFISSYSAGMKKKLAIMGTLLLKREIFLLDEPFNNLDSETILLIIAIIKKLKENGKTVVLSSHIIHFLDEFCDEVYFIEEKQIKKSTKSAESYTYERLSYNYEKILNGVKF